MCSSSSSTACVGVPMIPDTIGVVGRVIGDRRRRQSNPLCDFGIDRLFEEIGWNFRPFGTPLTGSLIGMQFRERGGDIRTAVDEVTQHPQLRALRRDDRDRGLRLVNASGGRQARAKQTTRSQQGLWAVRRRGSIDPLLRPPAGELLLLRIIGRDQQPNGRCLLELDRDLVDRIHRSRRDS